MIVHKIVTSPEAAVYLPFAMSKLRWMETNVKYAVSQTYIVNGVEIHIYHNPFTKQQYARLAGGGYAAYEFFTTDTFVYDPFPGTPPHTVPTNAYTCGHLTQLRLGPTLQPRKVVSYTGLDNAPITSYLDGAKGALLQNAFNDQKIEFRQNWTTGAESVPLPAVPDPELMTLSVTCTPDIYPPYYLMRQQTIENAARMLGDIGWDLRQTVFQKHAKKAIATVMTPAPKWWRRGTTLKTSRGLVVVVTDSFNNFYFFKLSDASQDSSLKVYTTLGEMSYIPLDKCVIVGQEAYMPSWAARCTDDSLVAMPYSLQAASSGNVWNFPDLPVAPPDAVLLDPSFAQQGWSSSAPKSAVFQVNQALWNFSADGSKAVAVVGYDRGPQMWQPLRFEEGKPYMRFQPLEPVVTARYCSLSVADVRIPAELQSQFPPELGLYPQNLVTPALVEVNIFAEIDDKGELTASVTLRSSDKDAWYVNADYAYRHPDLKALGVNEGDLITGEIRCYLHYPQDPQAYTPDVILGNSYCPLNNEEVATYRVRNGATTLLEIATLTMATDYTQPQQGVPIASVAVPMCREGDISGIGPYPLEYVYAGTNEYSPGIWATCRIKAAPYGGYTYECSRPYVGMVPTYVTNSTVPERLYAFLAACDLRSLSFVFHTFHSLSYDTEVTRGLLVYHHGVVEYSTPGADAYTRYAQDEWLDTHALKIYPTTSDMVKYQLSRVSWELMDGRVAEDLRTIAVNCYSVAHTSLPSRYEDGPVHLSTHPNGSYAVCAEGGAADWVYDKIVYSYLKDGVLCTSTTTHAEAFNKAFNQSRQHSDYGSATATFKYGSLGFSGGWV